MKSALILLIVMAGLNVGCVYESEPSRSSVPTSEPATTASSVATIAADELYAAYRADPRGADRKYKGKTLIIEGKVQIRPESSDQFTFLGGSIFGTPWYIHCEFTDADAANYLEMRQLQVGDAVVVKGLNLGRKAGAFFTIFTDCYLLDILQQTEVTPTHKAEVSPQPTYMLQLTPKLAAQSTATPIPTLTPAATPTPNPLIGEFRWAVGQVEYLLNTDAEGLEGLARSFGDHRIDMLLSGKPAPGARQIIRIGQALKAAPNVVAFEAEGVKQKGGQSALESWYEAGRYFEDAGEFWMNAFETSGSVEEREAWLVQAKVYFLLGKASLAETADALGEPSEGF